jgi:hypothetical protein
LAGFQPAPVEIWLVIKPQFTATLTFAACGVSLFKETATLLKKENQPCPTPALSYRLPAILETRAGSR